jgi:hypothetical protein
LGHPHKSLPASLHCNTVAGLSLLTFLHLTDNRLQSLPEGLFLLSLRRLSLCANRLPRVPLALATATQVRRGFLFQKKII